MNRLNKKNGLSGLIRARNEAKFISLCIDSCIDALDELIVVYNDCSDKTEEILKEKVKQYPGKLKIFPFNHNILSHNLSKEEFEYAISLPEDSLRLHSTQCNYALSKASYKYAMKIDPDQIYFSDEIKAWREICRANKPIQWKTSFILGWLFMTYISVYRRISCKIGKPCIGMLPNWLVKFFQRSYHEYIQWRLQKGTVAISLSGVNLFYDGEWTIPFDKYNVNPPYNGEGDTIIFKLTDNTFFSKYYSFDRPDTVIEMFHHPYKVVLADHPMWFHLHANRDYCYDKVKKVKMEHPELFVSLEKFLKMNYREVLNKMDPKVNTLFQRTLFALIHKMGIQQIKRHLYLLDKIKL